MKITGFFYCFFSLANHVVLQQVIYLQDGNKILKARFNGRLILTRFEKMLL